jgi:hypothetical protein
MAANRVLAGVAVADIEAAIGWYSRLIGRPVDSRPMDPTAEWQISGDGWLQLIKDPGRAGKSMVTIGVDSMDAQATDLAARGIAIEATTVPSGMFRIGRIADPDGNVITFAEDLRATT